MPVQFSIKVTKKIIELSKMCGCTDDIEMIGENCAIALALKDIFPEVLVTGHFIYPFGIDEDNIPEELKIALPKIARDFINVFDALCAIPNQRLLIPEFEFEIIIPNEIIERINIDEVKVFDPCHQ